MKTLLMIIILLTADSPYGPAGHMFAQYSYAPSYEHCVKEGIPYARRALGPETVAEMYGAMCVELSEEEDQDPINNANRIWRGLPKE